MPEMRGAETHWGSDAIVDLLGRAGIKYITLNPGASFRGLHDSFVNHAGENGPGMVLCLHEEHAVAIAHGWAKVTGEPLAVALHSNVGLMHASMALYNAWCDRVPMLVIGAAGPFDAHKRRPWIDWIHTSADQPALVRHFVKWDDSPTSLEASLESLSRAWDITRTSPTAPTYVVLDSAVQEQRLQALPKQPKLTTGVPLDQPSASDESVLRAAQLLMAANSPVLLVGKCDRAVASWDRRIRLAETLGARVITDLKAGAGFPTRHPAHVPGSGFFLSDAGRTALRGADAVLSLGWTDVAGTLDQAGVDSSVPLVCATLEPLLANGWSMDHQRRVQLDVWLPAEPDTAVEKLLPHLQARRVAETVWRPIRVPSLEQSFGAIDVLSLSAALQSGLADVDSTLIRLPLAWDGDSWDFEHPLDYLGGDGGAGIGSGPGMAVGAALALRDSDRLPVAVLGDGDYLMGVQAVWTAVNQNIPVLIVVANNRSYFNDEVHQEKIAVQRGRDVSRKWVGQRIADPAPDLAGLARAQGAVGYGPVADCRDLVATLRRAVSDVQAGSTVVVDVVVEPGYSPAMTAGLTRE